MTKYDEDCCHVVQVDAEEYACEAEIVIPLDTPTLLMQEIAERVAVATMIRDTPGQQHTHPTPNHTHTIKPCTVAQVVAMQDACHGAVYLFLVMFTSLKAAFGRTTVLLRHMLH